MAEAERKSAFHYKDVFIDVTASLAGGVAIVVMGQPFDTVKTKLQTYPARYRGMLHCLSMNYTEGGIKAVYAGAIPALVAKLAQNAVLFAAYGSCQRAMANVFGLQSLDHLTPVQNAAAGGLASFFSSLVLTPTELVKCRLQTLRDAGKNAKTSIPGVLRQVIAEDGIKGVYRGLTYTLAREMPGYFFLFLGYEYTRKLVTPAGSERGDLGPLQTTLCGSVGGLCFWTTMFPVDVAKSRIQVGRMNGSLPIVVMQIAKQEGIGALYRGLKPMAVRSIVAVGPLFLVYENVKTSLHGLLD